MKSLIINGWIGGLFSGYYVFIFEVIWSRFITVTWNFFSRGIEFLNNGFKVNVPVP